MSNILKSLLDANHLTTTRNLPPPGPPRCPQPRPDLRRRHRPGRRAAVRGARRRRLFGPGAVAQAAAGGHGDGGKL